MKIKFDTNSKIIADHDAVEIAQNINDAYEGLLLCCQELDAADAQMEAIQASIDCLCNIGGREAIRAVNMDGGLEDLLGISEDRITVNAAIEGLGEQARRAWDWFCKKVGEFWNWLTELFGKKSADLESKADRLDATAKQAATAIESAKSKTSSISESQISKDNRVPKFDDIEGLCILTSIMCDSLASAGGTTLVNVNEKGNTEAAGALLEKFSNSAKSAYDPIAKERPDGVKIMTEYFEGESKFSYKVLEIDYNKFLPEGVTSNYWTIGWTESNLKKVENVARILRKSGKKCRELSGKLKHKADSSESALKSITDASKQSEARKVVQVIRIIAKQLVESETVAGKTAGYHIECNNRVKRLADEAIRIVTSAQ